jgi:hypothetical protein
LYDKKYDSLKQFFQDAYKKERYLDIKLLALRGLSPFLIEGEVEKLLKGFRESLAKRQVSTPYNYQEYESLRGRNALPYLIEKYGYACFRETLAQVNKQYDEMPDAFKGHFTTNEKGDIVNLRPPGQTKWIIDKFFERERNK